MERIFGSPEIKEMRCMLHEKVFGEFVKEMGKVNQLEIMHMERDESLAIIMNSRKEEFTLKKFGIWDCECGYLIKCGLPCCHQIKVCLYLHQKLSDYVHKRWQIYRVEPKPKSYGRKTRRNLLK